MDRYQRNNVCSTLFALSAFADCIFRVSSSTGLGAGSITNLATRTEASGAIEASSIYKYGNYYYLFTSWDVCCQGTSSTYNIRVGRADSVSGTYYDADGVSLLEGGGTLVLETHDAVQSHHLVCPFGT